MHKRCEYKSPRWKIKKNCLLKTVGFNFRTHLYAKSCLRIYFKNKRHILPQQIFAWILFQRNDRNSFTFIISWHLQLYFAWNWPFIHYYVFWWPYLTLIRCLKSSTHLHRSHNIHKATLVSRRINIVCIKIRLLIRRSLQQHRSPS